MFDRDLLNKLRNTRSGKSRRWYNIRNLAEGEAEVFIYDVIGESWFGGISANQFVQDLRAIDAQKILLRINSPGGDVNEGIAIRNALLEHPAEVETHVDSAAYSTASWVAMAGDRVIMAPHATMMIHKAWDITGGDADAHRKSAEMLDLFDGQIADMYAKQGGGTRDEWLARMAVETWYTDQQAVDAGLADEISGQAESEAENQFDRSILGLFKNTPRELLDETQPARPEPTKRACEDALRDAGLSSAAAKALVSEGWSALTPRDAKDSAETKDELAREHARFEALRAGHLVTA